MKQEDAPRKGFKIVKRVLLALAAVFILIQLVPVDRSNPPATSSDVSVSAPEDVRAVLRKACYDCHSNETVWPWYSYVAPVSWLIAHDVHEGREELNFSAWNRGRKESHDRHEIFEEVSEGEMPLWYYVLLHPGASLSDKDKELLRDWTGSSGEKRGRHKEEEHEGDD